MHFAKNNILIMFIRLNLVLGLVVSLQCRAHLGVHFCTRGVRRSDMRVTATLPDSLAQYLQAVEREHEHDSHAEAVRYCIRRSREAEKLEDEIGHLEGRVEELTRQLQQANRRADDVTDLVEFVDEERSFQKRREARMSAPLWLRTYWWLVGYPTADERGYNEESAL